MKIAVIGTAFRKDDAKFLSKELYTRMGAYVKEEVLNQFGCRSDIIELISGGAAGADAIAVYLFLSQFTDKKDMPPISLKLCLPAEFRNGRFIGKTWKDHGSIANYHHDNFCKVTEKNSLKSIEKAIDLGATIEIYNGFFDRNCKVGEADCVIAQTFGTKSGQYSSLSDGYNNAVIAGLKDGGSSHTWNTSKAELKIHKNIFDLMA